MRSDIAGTGGFGGHDHFKGRQDHMDAAAEIVHAVKTPAGARVATGDVVAVVGKLFAGGEARGLADDLVAFDYELVAVVVLHDPFAAEEGHGVLGAVVQRHEIDERMRLVRRQRLAPVVIDEFVEAGGKAGEGERSGHNA